MQIGTDAVQILGGYGLHKELPLNAGTETCVVLATITSGLHL